MCSWKAKPRFLNPELYATLRREGLRGVNPVDSAQLRDLLAKIVPQNDGTTPVPVHTPVPQNSTLLSSAGREHVVHTIPASVANNTNRCQLSLIFFLSGHTAHRLPCVRFTRNFSTAPAQDDTADVEYTRFERPFMSSGTCGSTIWYRSSGRPPLCRPPRRITPHPGDIYIHADISTSGLQIWVSPTHGTWNGVPAEYDQMYLPDRVVKAARHPLFNDRVLKMRTNGEPSWVTRQTCITLKSRKKAGRSNDK